MKNVLEWLEATSGGKPDQPVYLDQENTIKFDELMLRAKTIGTFLAKHVCSQQPVAVFGERSAKTPGLFLGVVYSGRAYAPLDASQPKERLKRILGRLQPSAILADKALLPEVEGLAENCPVFTSEECSMGEIDEALLAKIRQNMTSLDPLYIIYTSGSTGIPKGVITSHDSLIRYIDAYAKVMEIEGTDRLGNQSPLDYIAAIRDIYLPLKAGCSTAIIPKSFFMEPNALFAYMNDMQVTCIGWSVSAFTVLSALGAFEESRLTTLKKICFSGSVMPAKCLRKWQQNLPNAKFINQYGPTEATASCTYYVVDHMVSEKEVLPIGTAYDNYRVFILKEDQTLAAPGEEGEICVCGPCLALGYYQDPERTRNSFVQNPLNNAYQERMYRTGDIGVKREDGILEFHGRKDRQVKHMGHRVELDEIEAAAHQIPGLAECCCIYQVEKEKLNLFYTGNVEKKTVILELRKVLPGFMVPRGVKQLEELPKLANGKTDMNQLRILASKRS